ncbi:PRP38 family-domain-containing protein [Radiomyces spectabilis]|uniref:PRP38 family-domain-containing protein n=1 Tax=Radiomyces spectabilis TaxID=64574 RepID=UPI0022203E96|nr:PRP38 family-domain-containing protein [Radiomyces spectabilis]KAI8381042.1 PRP38 family-domain-containing protein [Radiomyces spectabilis]
MSGSKASNKLETWGNETTMNLNAILYKNILASPYFKSLYEKKTFHEMVDEIYNQVYNLSPFLKGTMPSTAFVCLFKMWTLRLTVKQIENMIDHPDSPYIRAIGFLYLRYVCAPAQLWDWFSYYLEDDEELDLSGGPKPEKSTIGKLCRLLITEQKYQGTMLPRIPVPIARDLAKKLEDYDAEMKGQKHESERDNRRFDDRDRGGSRYRRDHSRSQSPRRRDRGDDRRRQRDFRNDIDDYERRRGHSRQRDRSRSRDRRSRYKDDDRSYRRRRSISPRDRYRSRSRSRSTDRGSRHSYRPSGSDRSRSYSRDR